MGELGGFLLDLQQRGARRGGILLAPTGEQRNAALLSNGGEGVHLAVGRNLLRFDAGTVLAKFVEKLFQTEVIEQLLEARRGCRHGRLIRILFLVRTTKQPPQPAISAATALMVSIRAWTPGSRKRTSNKPACVPVELAGIGEIQILGD